MPKIMISSTFDDLKGHREAVIEALQRMELPHAAMEFFGSRPSEPVDVCYKEIEKCDYLIGIYAWRYGWRPDPSGPSITEMEFDYARKLGKKCLCYIVDENHPCPVKLIEDCEAAKKN
ncbi:MAG: DUF4062 domain-containing protein [Nitrospirota bacterium]